MPLATIYNVQIRETDTNRHKLLGDGFLTTKRIHALRFDDADKAAEACQWLIANNPGAIESARVIDAETRKTVETVGLIRRV